MATLVGERANLYFEQIENCSVCFCLLVSMLFQFKAGSHISNNRSHKAMGGTVLEVAVLWVEWLLIMITRGY